MSYESKLRAGLEPTPDEVDAAIFDDLRKLRAQGQALRDLVINDMEAHESICDFIFSSDVEVQLKSTQTFKTKAEQ